MILYNIQHQNYTQTSGYFDSLSLPD